MKLNIIIIFFLVTLNLFSQKTIIFDKELGIPIKYASISYYDNNLFVFSTYCDEFGMFDLNTSYKDNKVVISCTGYYPVDYNFNKTNDTIFLKQQTEILSEVLIGKTNYTTIGYAKSKSKMLYSAYNGFEICTLIPNEIGILKNIKSVLFKMKVDKLVNTTIRLHFYEVQNDKKTPGNEIITKNIIKIFDSKFNGVAVIDVSNEKLILPTKGCFVGIEWLKTTNKQNNEIQLTRGTKITLNDDLNVLNTFYRLTTKTNFWQSTLQLKFDHNKLSLNKFKNYPNLSIGLEVY